MRTMFIVLERIDYVKSRPVRIFHTWEAAENWIKKNELSPEYEELDYEEIQVEEELWIDLQFQTV